MVMQLCQAIVVILANKHIFYSHSLQKPLSKLFINDVAPY